MCLKQLKRIMTVYVTDGMQIFRSKVKNIAAQAPDNLLDELAADVNKVHAGP
jgi:hypothetical protein